MTRTVRIAGAVVILLAAGPPPGATAHDGDRAEARAECGRGASGRLRARSRDGQIRVDFDVAGRPGSRWRVSVTRDGWVVYRGRRRVGRDGRFRVRKFLEDYSGAERLTARAVGPDGLTCSAAVVLPGSSW